MRRGLAAGIVPISTAQRLSALVSIPIEDGPRRGVLHLAAAHVDYRRALLHFSGIDMAG